jgi:hypothetical protein
MWIKFELTSECIDGQQVRAHVTAIGPAVGGGAKISDSTGSISFEDHQDTISTSNLSGLFGTVQASIIIVWGPSVGKIRIGNAFSRGGGDPGGFDVGVVISFGSSTVLSSKTEECSCEE